MNMPTNHVIRRGHYCKPVITGYLILSLVFLSAWSALASPVTTDRRQAGGAPTSGLSLEATAASDPPASTPQASPGVNTARLASRILSSAV